MNCMTICSSGALKKGDLDQRCLDQLKGLSETSGLEVVNKFSEADLASINSKVRLMQSRTSLFTLTIIQLPYVPHSN